VLIRFVISWYGVQGEFIFPETYQKPRVGEHMQVVAVVPVQMGKDDQLDINGLLNSKIEIPIYRNMDFPFFFRNHQF